MNNAGETLNDYLPESIQYLMTIIGVESVVLLIQSYGGAYVQVPGSAKPTHPLASLIGLGDFKKLVAVFADTALEIPACCRVMSLMQAFCLLQEHRAGASHRELALRHGISKRSVSIWLKKAKSAEKTLPDDAVMRAFRKLFDDAR